MKTTRAKTRITKLAATLLLAGGILTGSTAGTAASFNARQIEPLGGGGGRSLAFARQDLTLLVAATRTPVGMWRGGQYVGFLPE